MKPGDLVTLHPTNRCGTRGDPDGDVLSLWKHEATTLEELQLVDSTALCGWITNKKVGLVIARVPSLNGVAGTETDSVLLLVGEYLGWNSCHWFQRVDGRETA
jgi:hypothetical protein